MRHCFITSCLLTMFITLSSGMVIAADTPEVTIHNQDFETTEIVEGRTLPVGWSNAYQRDAKIYVFPKSWANNEDARMHIAAVPAAARSGKLGLELQQAGGPRMYAESRAFPLPVQKETWYEVTTYVRATKDQGGWAQIQILRGGLVATSEELLLTRDWQLLTCQFKSTASSVTLRMVGWVIESDIHFDDASVRIIDPPTTPTWGGSLVDPNLPTGRERFLNRPTPIVSGELYVERPTHHSIGVQWDMAGDYNRNANVAVSYREKDSGKPFSEALPLHRSMWESVRLPMTGGIVVPNMFAGSVMGLEAGKNYEIQLNLTDPDGGSVVKTFEAATRPIPPRHEGLRTLHVYPYDNPSGLKPAYVGLKAAYEAAEPGDVILVHEGFYDQAPDDDGWVYHLNKKATADKPIVIRGAPKEKAVFTGRKRIKSENGAFQKTVARTATVLFDMDGAEHNHIENIIVTFCEIGFMVRNSVGVVVRGCFIEPGMGYGIAMEQPTASDMTIRDNVFYGGLFEFWDHRDDWLNQRGGYSSMHRPYAIFVAGQGHDIAFNTIYGWHDGINLDTYNPPPADPKLRTCSVDVHNNIITGINDDGMELEPIASNVIVRENLITRCFMALSFQAIYGGPVYIIRNVIYDIDSMPFKLVHSSAGATMYHNTVIAKRIWLNGDQKNGKFVNNLFMTSPESNYPSLMGMQYRNIPSRYDYNGYGPKPGPISWSVYYEFRSGWATSNTFPDLTSFAKATGQETHGIGNLQYDQTFVSPQFDQDRSGDNGKPHDLRLKPGSLAIDAGTRLPSLNDNFTGKAPDMGAHEFDAPLPHYGPRPEWDPESWRKVRTGRTTK